MKHRAWAWLALSSLAPLWCATRPHYGGTLAVDLGTAFNTLEPGELPSLIGPVIVETLVRVNARGEMEPLLAASWQWEAEGRRWRFPLRSKVVFHDGEPLTAANAAPALLAALKKTYPDITVSAGGQTIVIQSERPMPDLLAALADSRAAIVQKSDSGALLGTGPFRVASWDPGRRLTLAAFEDYWGGRPYLDSVTVNLASTRANADVLDIPFASPRRIVPEAMRTWSSPPRELMALTGAGVDPVVWQALALAIDRAPIVDALTQRRGQPAFGLLPQWLSGYAFLFQSGTDLARARQLAGSVRAAPLTLTYSPADSFARAVAERIALNARDAGITLRPSAGGASNLRLVRWTLESSNAVSELARLAALAGVSGLAGSFDPSKPEALYQAERGLLDGNRILPLVYLPVLYGLASRVHNAERNDALNLHLENLWVDP